MNGHNSHESTENTGSRYALSKVIRLLYFSVRFFALFFFAGTEPSRSAESSETASNRISGARGSKKWQAASAAAFLFFPLIVAAQSKGPGAEAKVLPTTFHTNGSDTAQNQDRKSETETKTIRIWDACDPASFDAAVRPGTCKPGHHGQTNFSDFFAELQLDHIAGGWRFNPLLNTTDGMLKLVRLELERGDRISLENVGGETHTFTRVEEFAGGYFAPLNPLTGNPEPAPECARVLADGSLAPQPETDTNQFVEAGTTELGPIAGTRALPLGVTHWQCCVHPWMRINVVVRDRDHEHDHQP